MARTLAGPARPPLRWFVAVGLVTTVVLGFAGVIHTAHAATITVTTTEDQDNTSAPCSLREAIIAANTNAAYGGCAAGSGTDTITLPAGTFEIRIPTAGENAAATGDLDLTQDVVIRGAGSGQTVIDGAWQSGIEGDRIFHVVEGTLTLEGVTVQDGGPDTPGNGGGGILVDDGGVLNLTDSLLFHNETPFGFGAPGGGLAILAGGEATIRSSQVANSFAMSGAGIFVDGGATLLVEDSIIGGESEQETVSFPQRNAAWDNGGGILNRGTVTLRRTSLEFNFSFESRGGGIDNDGGDLIIEDSAVIRNSSGESNGGGIYNAGALSATNVTFSGNSAATNGGAIHHQSGSASLVNATFSRNRSDEDGDNNGNGGGVNVASGTMTIRNSIFGGNQDPSPSALAELFPDCAGTITSEGRNLVQDPAGCAGFGGSDILGQDPLILPLADNGGPTRTHALQPNSRAIDGAANTPAVDQRSVPRPVGSAPDIGAYERVLCFGSVVNVVGTQADDTIDRSTIGGAADVVLALGGNDQVFSGPGSDRVCAGAGDDRLLLGTGRDRGNGEAGNDILRGGGNPDKLRGGSGKDLLVGGGTLRDKGDICRGGGGNDRGKGCERSSSL